MLIHNLKHLKSIRRSLRSGLTPSEARLWKALKNSQLDGRKFRRQHSIGNYIVDFYCPAEKLVVEVDGGHHFTVSGEMADIERDAFLQELNIRVLWIPNEAVHHQFDMVLEAILDTFQK